MIQYMATDWRLLLAEATGFDWDAGTRVKSVAKHQVACGEAEAVFMNRPLLLLEDPAHSRDEPRLKALGRSHTGRLLTVSFALRPPLIRIISARPMNRKERVFYEARQTG